MRSSSGAGRLASDDRHVGCSATRSCRCRYLAPREVRVPAAELLIGVAGCVSSIAVSRVIRFGYVRSINPRATQPWRRRGRPRRKRRTTNHHSIRQARRRTPPPRPRTHVARRRDRATAKPPRPRPRPVAPRRRPDPRPRPLAHGTRNTRHQHTHPARTSPRDRPAPRRAGDNRDHTRRALGGTTGSFDRRRTSRPASTPPASRSRLRPSPLRRYRRS